MKNAITVIDQELIDYIEAVTESQSINVGMVAVCRVRLDELLSMAKDLIEINAELTKREQKYKNVLKVFAEESTIKYTPFGKVINDLLKGDSDE